MMSIYVDGVDTNSKVNVGFKHYRREKKGASSYILGDSLGYV